MVDAINLTSLLQLGVGLGIGLSFFRATLNRKLASFNTRFDRVHNALSAPDDEVGRRQQNLAVAIRARFKRASVLANGFATWSQVAALAGAAVNVWLLIKACTSPEASWDPAWSIWWSVGYFVVLLVGVELVLFLQLCRIDSDLEVVEREAGIRG